MDAHLLASTLADLDQGLLERDAAVRLTLLAALAGEHVLLIGPPGTAKSELARRLQRVFVDARYFERLLTRFSVPEELFGPLSLRALEDDRYERLTEGFLPTAQVAFLDEVFKANSAILNALLTLLNEREFDNGSTRVRVPLITVVGATNEVPDDEALRAFHDRFLLRVPVGPVQDDSFPALLALPIRPVAVAGRIRAAELEALRAAADAVRLPAEVVGLLQRARSACLQQQMAVSDRRWRKLVALLQIQAASRGAKAVDPWDLWLLPFVLAERPAQVDALVQQFFATVARAEPLDLQWVTRAAEAFDKQLEIETQAQAMDDDGAGKLALARAIAGDTDSGQAMVRIVARAAQRRYSGVHIQARVAQVDDVLLRARALQQQAQDLAAAVLTQARAQLWLPPSWLRRIEAIHGDNIGRASALAERLTGLRQGFADLPQDAAAEGLPPAPIAVVPG